MADYSLADHLQGREPQTQTIATPPSELASEMARHAKAFGYGLVDPWGLSGYGARGLAHMAPSVLSPETARRFANNSTTAQNASPIAAGMSSMLVPGLGFAGTVGRMTARELAGGIAPLMSLGGAVGGLRQDLSSIWDDFTGENSFANWDDRRRGPMPVLPGAPY